VLTESAKKLRDPLALGLLGAAGLYVIATMCVLFNDDIPTFSLRSMMTQAHFVNPVLVIVTVAAALLVSAWEPTPMARIVVMGALGVQGLMALFGLITWFASYGLDTGGGGGGGSFAEAAQAAAAADPTSLMYGGIIGAGKVVGTLLMLAMLAILAVGIFLVFSIFQALPAPVRQPQQQWAGQQQQWGGQPQQQQWGGQPQQQQWGGQPQQWGGQQQQWGAAGGAAAGAAAGQGWGQPTSGESSTGYAAGGQAGQPMPGSGESSTGYAAGGDPGQPPQPQQWGQPQQPQETQQWGQQPEAPQQQEGTQEGEDDRPGWWSPSS
jgi:hypothetical protein